MKAIERWLIKLVVIQFIILLCVQIFIHYYHFFPELQKIKL
ncbi:DUF5359 family protein [Bacillus chungangensis]|uniref:YpfB family protein n=1 Tax=Bacillus chungangensis TaxID=587633 RepID=A0ABT9WYL3_9BACI|nr:DUF5359 family protein [Bacillus chungangensis]MDQ0178390.1 hypothetical protein [Bacillus chungangensis]